MAEVSTDLMVAALKPIWRIKEDMARKVRGRIENVIDYAVARKYRPEGPNPASLKGPLGKLLPPQARNVVHHASAPYSEIPALFARLQATGSVTTRALAFVLLTAVRMERPGWPDGASSTLRRSCGAFRLKEPRWESSTSSR